MKRVPKPVDPLERQLAQPVPRRGRRAATKAVARPAVMVDVAPTPNFATFGLPRPAPKRAKGADVIGPDTDVTLEMVEALMDEGIDVVAATSMVQLSALWANRPALGRPSEAPRLGDRTARKRTNGEPGHRKARIVFHGRYTTTGIVLQEGEDVEKHQGAKIFLRTWKKREAKQVLGRLQARERTLSQIFQEMLTDLDPGMSKDPGLTGPYKTWLSDAKQLEELIGSERFVTLPGNIAERYVLERIQYQIKSQLADNADPRLVDPATADTHVDTLFFLLRKFCEKHYLQMPRLTRLKIPRKPARWLNWWQLWKLIRYARGYMLDAAGKIVGRHGDAARYACLVRFILIYVYGGTRKKNIHQMTWGMDSEFGHIDVRNGEIQRQGPEARITNKRRGTSFLIGSLQTLSWKWFNEDEAAREALGNPTGRYVHILHDEEGYELAKGRIDTLLGEVCEAVGIKRITSHVLKHTGVTLCSRAGMPLQEVEEAFSTDIVTLIKTYRHLYGRWFVHRPNKVFDPKDLNMLRLRRFSPMDKDEVYAAAA